MVALLALGSRECVAAQSGSVSVAAAGSEAAQTTFQFVAQYLKDLSDKELFAAGPNFAATVTPEFDFAMGGGDAFNGGTAKATGAGLWFRTKSDGHGNTVIDSDRCFLVVPMSIGMETDKDISFVNGLAELGASPVPN